MHFEAKADGNVRYQRFDPRVDSMSDELDRVAVCYQEVFATRPWSEWKKCSVCNASWGLESKAAVESINGQHCGKPVSDFWPLKKIKQYMKKNLSEDSSCWLAVEGGRVIGFCWGSQIEPWALEKKFGIALPTSLLGFNLVALQSEIGVIHSCRGRKIAKSLYSRRSEDFLARGLKIGVLRTRRSPEPSITYQWFKDRLGYEVVAEYPSHDGRVVMAQGLEQALLLANS